MKKIVFDLLLSTTALVALSPLMAGIAVGTKLTLKGPIIYKQPRVGQHKEIFTIYKFRSMTNACNENGELLPDSERITKFGKFIRKYGLDELPQLFNILAGDMSFVGPRPRVEKGHLKYEIPDTHSIIYAAKPGLTGPTQIARMMRGAELPLQERLEKDFNYAVKPPSILRDAWLITKTVPIFVLGNGAKTSTVQPDFF